MDACVSNKKYDTDSLKWAKQIKLEYEKIVEE